MVINFGGGYKWYELDDEDYLVIQYLQWFLICQEKAAKLQASQGGFISKEGLDMAE